MAASAADAASMRPTIQLLRERLPVVRVHRQDRTGGMRQQAARTAVRRPRSCLLPRGTSTGSPNAAASSSTSARISPTLIDSRVYAMIAEASRTSRIGRLLTRRRPGDRAAHAEPADAPGPLRVGLVELGPRPRHALFGHGEPVLGHGRDHLVAAALVRAGHRHSVSICRSCRAPECAAAPGRAPTLRASGAVAAVPLHGSSDASGGAADSRETARRASSELWPKRSSCVWTARAPQDLVGVLHDLGEHIAAGAPIAPLSTEENERLAAIMRDLNHALGRRCSPYCDHLRDSNADSNRTRRAPPVPGRAWRMTRPRPRNQTKADDEAEPCNRKVAGSSPAVGSPDQGADQASCLSCRPFTRAAVEFCAHFVLGPTRRTDLRPIT